MNQFAILSCATMFKWHYLLQRYCEYAASVTRTIFMNPTEDQQYVHELTRRVLDFAVSQLKPGEIFGNIYRKSKAMVQANWPHLVPRLVKTLGYYTGLETMATGPHINENSKHHVESDRTFVVAAGFEADTTEQSQERPLVVWLAETVFVPASGLARVLTHYGNQTENKRPKCSVLCSGSIMCFGEY